MNDNVRSLPATVTFTVEQALKSALQSADLKCVAIVGEDSEGNLFVRSSRMTREEANWLYDRAKLYTLGIANMKGHR
jgi:hypothetical protein